MEIKSTLNKPYTEEQRIDFIVTQNHQNGFEIKETETALEAWGKTAEEEEEAQKQIRKTELISQLDDLDLKEIRPLAAKAAGTATDEDDAKLAEIEQAKQEIRAELKDL